MATLSVLEQAKTMFVFDDKYELEIDNALPLATKELRVRLLAPEFMRYMNSADEVSITSFSDSAVSGQTTISIASVKNIKLYDMIVISDTANYNGYYEIKSVDSDNDTFDIQETHTIDETGLSTNETLETIKTAHAWLILYFTTFSLQKLEKGKVLISSEEFGEGQIRTYGQDELNALRSQYIRNAEMLIGRVNSYAKA